MVGGLAKENVGRAGIVGGAGMVGRLGGRWLWTIAVGLGLEVGGLLRPTWGC